MDDYIDNYEDIEEEVERREQTYDNEIDAILQPIDDAMSSRAGTTRKNPNMTIYLCIYVDRVELELFRSFC